MAIKNIQCSFLPKSKREALYEKFKEGHPKTPIMSFINYLNYAASFMGLDLNSSDDIILNKVNEALKQIEKNKENIHSILPQAKVLSPISSAEDELYSIEEVNNSKQISIHDVPANLLDDVIESIIEDFGIETSNIANNLRNNLQSSNRMNVFLRFLAREQLYAELTGADNETVVANAIKNANMLFATSNMFKEDGTAKTQERLDRDYDGIVQPWNENKTGYITYTTGKGYTIQEAISETNRINMEETDATVIVRPANGKESHTLRRIGENSEKTAAQVWATDPKAAAENMAKGLAKKKGAKIIFIKGNTLNASKMTQSEWNEYMFTMLQEAKRLGADITEIRTDGMDGVGVAAVIAASALGIKTSMVVPAYESNGKLCFPTGSDIKFGVFDKKGSNSKTSYLNRFSKTAVDNFKARLGIKASTAQAQRGQEGVNNGQTASNNIQSNSPLAGRIKGGEMKEGVELSTKGYSKADPINHKDTDYIFTDNAQAYVAAQEQDDSWIEDGYNKGNRVKTGVSDMNGSNQAGVRASSSGTYGAANINSNAYGVVVKKYQQKSNSNSFLSKEGQFKDTDEDFELFKSLNTDMFDRLDASSNSKKVFPQQMALGKAALSMRFVEWLQDELSSRYGITSQIQKNTKAGYEGYGLQLDKSQFEDNSASNYFNNSQSTSSRQENNTGEESYTISEIQAALQIAKGNKASSASVTNNEGVVESSTQERAAAVTTEAPKIESKARATLDVNDNSPKGRLYRLINPQTVQHREAMIARDFKEMVNQMIDEAIEEIEDRLQRTDDEALASRFDDLEMQLALEDEANARKTFIIKTGANKIFERIKDKYRRKMEREDTTDYEREQYQIVLDNFDILMSEAKVMIESKENLIIDRSRENDEGDIREAQEGANGNDGWVVKARTTDPHTTISGLTRQALEDIAIINPETGENEYDDLGYPLFYNEDDLHGILIKEMASLISPDDFATREDPEDIDSPLTFNKLESLKGRYGWIDQLTRKLKRNEQLAATFYTDFRKDFISYWKTKRGKSIELNADSGTESQFSVLEANYGNGLKLTGTSIYTTNSTIDKSQVEPLETLIGDLGESLDDFELGRMDDDDVESKIVEPLMKLYKSLGFTVTKTDVQYIMSEDVNSVRDSISKAGAIIERLKISDSENENYVSENDSYTDTFRKELRGIAKTIGTVDAEYVIASLRQGDETRYSYSAPNYIDTMFKNLTHKDPKYRKEYIENKWGKYGWFRDQDTGEWKVKWIEDLYNDAVEAIEKGEDGILYKELKMKDIPYVVSENRNGTEELVKYNDWTAEMIVPSYIGEYFAYPQSQFANYNFPIFADSPCAKFIRMRRYSGEDYKEEILNEMLRVARQELWRMQFVEQRYEDHAEPIQNFDNSTKDGEVKYGRGSQFCFFPFLNTMTFRDLAKMQNPNMDDKQIDSILGDYISAWGLDNVDSKTTIKDAIAKNNGPTRVDDVDNLIKTAIKAHLNDEFNKFVNEHLGTLIETFHLLRENGVVESLGYSIEDANDKGEEIAETLYEEYYWNQQLATAQIIEMTTVDLAFYKNATDFQKRYKEVYASGGKLFTNSKYGRKFEKTLYLKDFSLGSRSWSNLKKAALDAKDRGELHDSEMLDILDKYIANNQVDAQAYRSISSYRAVLDMMGLWDERMDGILQRFQDGTWTSADFNVVWGTIKPFLYTVSESANGTSDASYGTMMVPHQNKNSEFVILATIQTIGGLMSQSPKMRALNRFMEDTGVDVVQFESAVKAGGQGTVDLGFSQENLEVEAETLNENRANNYVDKYLAKVNKKAKEGKELTELPASHVVKYYNYGLMEGFITQKEYNKAMDLFEPDETEVYEKLIESNTLNVQRDNEGNILYHTDPNTGLQSAAFNGEISFDENRIHTHSYDDYMIAQPTPQHFMDTDAVFGSQFRNLIISDIPNMFNGQKTTFTINGKTYTKQQLLDTYKKLITENLLDAYVETRERFRDIYALQKYLKEQVQGNPKFPADMVDAFEIVDTPKGPVFNIPLSNPSTTIKIQELINSTFKNAVTKQRIKGGSAILVSSFGFSKQLEVVRNDDGSIKEIECYMPAYSKQFYEPFMGEDGTLDIEKMKKMAPDLLKVIGYRIPTENKYSMCNLRIKGFLPQQNGGAIMLPAEITTMSGADFDKLSMLK